MNVSIRKKIYWGFLLLVLLFVVNGIASIITLNKNRKLAEYIATVTDPSIKSLEDFSDLLISSRMYSTNWVFLRSNQDDKEALKRLHRVDYPALKMKLNSLSGKWSNKSPEDSLHKIFSSFEELIVVEKRIMSLLQKFGDYDDPVAKLESEMLVEDEILPRTSSMIKALSNVISLKTSFRDQKNEALEQSFMQLRMLISALAVIIISAGIFLSLHMARVIISPVKKIRDILNDLGKGIIRKIDLKIRNDEIGEMVKSVNNLSNKLQATAAFAREVGNRNFDSHFEPLGPEDTLGRALVTMRNNLRTSDESLNEAQHIAKLGNWEWDLITNNLFWSDEVYNIFDVNASSFVPGYEKYLNFVHPEDKEYASTFITKCLQDQQPFSYECRIITNTNVEKTISAGGKVYKAGNGELIRLGGIIQDITESKKAQKELEGANRELNILFNSIDEIFFSVNMTALKVIQISKTCEKLYGYTQAEFLSNYLLWLDIIHPDDKHVVENENEIMANGGQINNQYRIIRKDKAIRWVETSISPTLDKKGNLIRVDGVTRDITQKKNAEVELHDSEERYRQILETAQEGIWMIDENNDTTFINTMMCEMIEYSAEEVIGKKIHLFMDADANKNAAAQIERRKQGISETHDSKFITKSGKVVLASLSTNPVFDNNRVYKGALAMVTDITKRKHDEQLLQKSQENLALNFRQLEQKNKELEQFAYVASHDLQEPLRTTISFVETFKKQYYGKIDARADKYLTYITQASDRMRVLIKDLLDFSRIGINKDLEQVDCNTIFNDVIADLQKVIKDSNAEIRSESLPVISGYATELKQLFQNLIINSIKFRKKNIPPRVEITAKKMHHGWQFAFADNGIGIDQQHNERIFIIFQRLHTRSEYQGSGIGLSHCKKIVELHNGKIWMKSIPGEGSTFYFTLSGERAEPGKLIPLQAKIKSPVGDEDIPGLSHTILA